MVLMIVGSAETSLYIFHTPRRNIPVAISI